jgi:hypothetical protein
MYDDIDYEELRSDLLNYYGTFMVNIAPAAVFELSRIERANYQELLMIARENNFDVDNYKLGGKNL